MKRRRAIRALYRQRLHEFAVCCASDHLGAGSLLRYGADRYGTPVERCPYCGWRL